MKYRWRDLPAILQNPLAAQFIKEGIRSWAWPVYRLAASVYRRTALRETKVVAVTGSFGKTTTCRAVAAALGVSIQSGTNHKSGLARRLLSHSPKDPYCVLEAGIDGPGQMRGFAKMMRPDIAVVSGIGTEHSRSLGTLEKTRDEKAELAAALSPAGLAVLNADVPLAASVRERTRARTVLCGFAPEADVRVESYRLNWPKGIELHASVRGETVTVQTPVLGRHMAFPVLAALVAAQEAGIPLSVAAERLDRLEPPPGRMRLTPLENGVVFVDDSFKGSFESFVAALDTLAELPGKRRLMIVGDITEPPGRQSDAYGLLGESFARVPEGWILHIGREAQFLRSGAKRAGFPADRIIALGRDVLPALQRIREIVQPGDTVLLKGRDTQKLERISMAFQGLDVRCGIRFCDRRLGGCSTCPMLTRGWAGLPEFMDQRARFKTRPKRTD